MSEKLEELKQEAAELGISHSPNIGEEKLQSKIDEYYKSEEKKAPKIEVISEGEAPDTRSVSTGKTSMTVLAKKLYDKARQTRIVTIIDNDQRVNNQTTTCKANWTNNYYDMGTRIFPLNIPIEIPIGFINVLKEVQIPHHTKDPKTGLAVTTMRPRYTISYEDINNS